MVWLLHHPKPLAIVTGVLLSVAALSMQPQGADLSNRGLLDVFGGSLPYTMTMRLEQINREIQQAKSILSVRSNRLRILTAEDEIRAFSFEHGALWVDGQPFLKNIDQFHFEFRDCSGNLMTRAQLRVHQIELITYLLRINDRSKPVLGSARIPVTVDAQTRLAVL